ncbi:MAG: hypothetical protein J07HX64_02500 [halophilic archaeon J07HX64]|jgi:hypothetical protein|nr:MAG: hypothetical protein J07HX64_02500 [halophilic archaeon J07HX64]
MRRFIICGDPGIRKRAVIEYDGRRYVRFGINRQGDWYGPEQPQFWCTVGSADEEEAYERREYIPMHLDVEAIDADEVEVLRASR